MHLYSLDFQFYFPLVQEALWQEYLMSTKLYAVAEQSVKVWTGQPGKISQGDNLMYVSEN